jgi:hypothetical protein
MHDRAWPFPSNGIDARECERTQGWNVRCVDGWREQQVRTAGLVAVACVANLAFVVSIVASCTSRGQHWLIPERSFWYIWCGTAYPGLDILD